MLINPVTIGIAKKVALIVVSQAVSIAFNRIIKSK